MDFMNLMGYVIAVFSGIVIAIAFAGFIPLIIYLIFGLVKIPIIIFLILFIPFAFYLTVIAIDTIIY